MSVPRRVFLQGVGSAAVGLTVTTPVATPSPRTAPLPVIDDVNPIEHFQQMRQVLIDNDTLLGPRQVIPIVREQINIIQQFRSNSRGADQRELVRVQAQYTQFYGWLYQDAGEYHLAESCIDRALALAHMAADHDLAAYILARKAHLAGDMHVPADAVGAAEQALRMAPPHSRTAVVAATFAGHGYALSGDQGTMDRAYDRACELLGSIDIDPGSPYGTGWLDETYIALHRARSTAGLGITTTRPRAFSMRSRICPVATDVAEGSGSPGLRWLMLAITRLSPPPVWDWRRCP